MALVTTKEMFKKDKIDFDVYNREYEKTMTEIKRIEGIIEQQKEIQ